MRPARRKSLAVILSFLTILSAWALFGTAGRQSPFTGKLTAQELSLPAVSAAAGGSVSGFVYEAVRSNRIEGASVSLYAEEAPSGDPVPPEADAPGREDPPVTDANGAFRLEAPAGKWRIGAAKAHYKAAYSDWTAVPSGETVRAIPLVSAEAPEVVGVIRKKDCITLTFTQYMDLETIGEDTIVLTNNGETVAYEIYSADREMSGTDENVYYARSFNIEPKKDPTSITVKGVKNYAGTALKGSRVIPAEAFRPYVAYTLGDVDGDGHVTPADARLTLRASVGLFPGGSAGEFGEGGRMFLASDCDSSGRIDSGDARTILRASVGLELGESNSALASYANLTDKHDDRTRRIDTITVHHMDGVMTAQECCDYFCETEREVSVNYCIGYDGSVALNVEEKYRAWASSSEANDMRAVTIEVSNDGYDADRHVSDAAFDKLVELCADICRRNGISELVYTGDAAGNLTMHKMFIATDCPGPYLSRRFGDLAEQVNKRLTALRSSP